MASKDSQQGSLNLSAIPDAVAFTTAVTTSLLYASFVTPLFLHSSIPATEALLLLLTGQVLVFVGSGYVGYVVAKNAVNAVQQR